MWIGGGGCAVFAGTVSKSTLECVVRGKVFKADDTTTFVEIDVVVDTGCQEYIILAQSDVETLGLVRKRQSIIILADGSETRCWRYSTVDFIIALSDGTEASATLAPVVMEQATSDTAEASAGAAIERLLGYPGIDLLNLKVDPRNHRLIRRTKPRRV